MTEQTDAARIAEICERLRKSEWGANIADTLSDWQAARHEAAAMIEGLAAKAIRSMADD